MERKKRYLTIFLAVNLIGISVALMLESQMGCDPIGLLCDGISHLLNIQFGLASFFYNLLMIALALLISRKNLGTGTVVYGLLSGFFIDFYRMIFQAVSLADSQFLIRLMAFVLGEILMSAAFAILMQLHLGMTALDAVLMKIREITHFPYSVLKFTTDTIFVVTGILWGGIFGAGTIASALVTGFLVSRIARMIEFFQTKKDTVMVSEARS